MIALSEALTGKLASAKRIVAFTGAGMSAESGVPTFRGNEGIWKKFRPEELATFAAFRKNPELVWSWYSHRRSIIRSVRPNAGHLALAELERYYRVTIVTQNIDNLHRRAGSTSVCELHGNIERNYCADCGKPYTGPDEGTPKCAGCGGFVRPDVVWFGELLPADEWNHGVDAARWADVFLSVGTSGVVYPAASIPDIARKAGAYVVEINIDQTDLSAGAHESIRSAAAQALPPIVETARRLHGGRTGSPGSVGSPARSRNLNLDTN